MHVAGPTNTTEYARGALLQFKAELAARTRLNIFEPLAVWTASYNSVVVSGAPSTPACLCSVPLLAPYLLHIQAAFHPPFPPARPRRAALPLPASHLQGQQRAVEKMEVERDAQMRKVRICCCMLPA